MHFSLVAVLRKNIKSLLLLAVVTCIAYGFSLSNTFVWDDEQFIYNNVFVKNFAITEIFTQNTVAGAGETSTYYRPLTTLSFAIDYALWGLNPTGFHITNTLLHLFTGFLLFLYLQMIRLSKKTSLFITLLFLVHPLQTEAVVYANSRGDSLYAFWTMISLTSFCLLLKNKIPFITIYDLKITADKKTLVFLTVCSYLLAILSKEIGIATIGLLGLTFLLLHIQTKNTFSITQILKNTYGIATLSAAIFTALFYFFFRTKIITIPTTQDIYFAGTTYGESIFVRLHTFTQALWTYWKLLLIPYPLHMERSLEILEQPISVWLVGVVAVVLALIFFSVREYKKQKTTYISFGSLWFIGMLVPVSGIIPVNGLVYEHWLYLPMVGFFITLYGLQQTLLNKKLQQKISATLEYSIVFVLILFVILTIRQNYIWGNPIRFYTYTLQFSSSARLHNNLAMAYADIQDYQNAVLQYKKAIELADYYPQTHYNLANTYLALGETELAIKEFETAIEMNENFLPAYPKLMQIFSQKKSYTNITPLIDKLVTVLPEDIELQYYKAQNLIDTGNITDGLALLESLKDNPTVNPQLRLNITRTIQRYE